MSIEIFISYADEDDLLRQKLDKHLSLLEQHNHITIWHKGRIIPGQEPANEIDAHLNRAQIILLLVSPDFMASQYLNGIEVKRAMERYAAGDAHVIPVILRRVDWKG